MSEASDKSSRPGVVASIPYWGICAAGFVGMAIVMVIWKPVHFWVASYVPDGQIAGKQFVPAVAMIVWDGVPFVATILLGMLIARRGFALGRTAGAGFFAGVGTLLGMLIAVAVCMPGRPVWSADMLSQFAGPRGALMSALVIGLVILVYCAAWAAHRRKQRLRAIG